MTGRGLAAVLVALAALGVASGATAAALTGPDTHPSAITPLPASSPSLPIDPVPPLAPDSTLPPMPVQLPTTRTNLGGDQFGFDFPMPTAWVRNQTQTGQARWTLPGDPPGAYFARVEIVSGESRTAAEFIQSRPQDLARATTVSNLEVLDSGDHTLLVCFVLQGSADKYRRECTAYAWVPGPGHQPTDNADLEIAVTGRRADLTGIQALRDLIMTHVSRPS